MNALSRRCCLAGLATACLPGLVACETTAVGRRADEPHRIAGHALTLTPDIDRGTVAGRLLVRLGAGSGAGLQLDIGDLLITSVTEGGRPLAFHQGDRRLQVEWPSGTVAPREIEIVYHGAPSGGIHFDAAASQVHTAFATSQWMPCLDAPDQRAPLSLTLRLPPGLTVAATGTPVVTQAEADGRIASQWRLDTPMPSYLYGFAAGRFTEAVERAGAVELRLLATTSFDATQLRRVFRDTADMLAFFERRAGVPYPAPRYTQVLLKGAAAQELAGIALLGERYGRRVLDDEGAQWLGAHELAHTWWGNGVTNRAWTEFWLNEGLASFMTAAWFEHRFGRARYDALIDAAREKVDALRAAGKDRALVFPDWNRPSADDRSIVYDKGAWVVHLLREELGEPAFWRGLQRYTRTHWGRSVSSLDFQRAMEAASGRDLQTFFRRWVHGDTAASTRRPVG